MSDIPREASLRLLLRDNPYFLLGFQHVKILNFMVRLVNRQSMYKAVKNENTNDRYT